jgi:hypothetical protein
MRASRLDQNRPTSRADSIALVPTRRIAHAILALRGRKVMLDSDLAALYHVPIKALNQAVNEIEPGFPQTSCFSSPLVSGTF